jgi:hypothetical protein
VFADLQGRDIQLTTSAQRTHPAYFWKQLLDQSPEMPILAGMSLILRKISDVFARPGIGELGESQPARPGASGRRPGLACGVRECFQVLLVAGFRGSVWQNNAVSGA